MERLQPERSLATTPIFQVLLNVLDAPPAATLDFPGLTADHVPACRCAPPSTT